MTDLPLPPVPADADLQDFPFMPLHVARLRDSDLAAEESPEACWYAVLLWAASWHQLPAGSLPDNDVVLMKLVGLGRDHRTWKKHRTGALRGFVQCSDGRFYHQVVSEQVNAAWNAKLAQKHRTFCSAVRKHNERNKPQVLEVPTFEEWIDLGRPDRVTPHVAALSKATEENVADDKPASHTENGCDNGSNRQGQGQGQGQGDSYKNGEPNGSLVPAASADDDEDGFFVGLDLGEDPPAEEEKPLSPTEIMGSWNRLAEELGLPKVEKLSPDRLTKIGARLKAYPEIRYWQQAFNTIRRSPFLLGDSPSGWKADFDFLIQAKSFNRLVEGSYSNGAG